MTDPNRLPPSPTPPPPNAWPQQSGWPQGPTVPGLSAPQSYLPMTPTTGEVGHVRGTGACMLLAIVTFGIYTLVWYYKTHEEMKRHSGQGLGGVLALVILLIFGIASPFLVSNEVGALYERRGQTKPVTALTALWYFPGVFILVGPIVWFVKTNGALNAYWRSLGAR